MIFRLEPWFANVQKRLVKSPKLYFHDVGLAAHLHRIEVKASATARADQSQGLEKLADVLPGGLAQRVVVYDGYEEVERAGVRYLRPEGLAEEVRRAGLGG